MFLMLNLGVYLTANKLAFVRDRHKWNFGLFKLRVIYYTVSSAIKIYHKTRFCLLPS